MKVVMRICHATNWLPGYHKIWGGAEQASYRTIKLLIKNGYDVDVISTKPVKEPKEDFDFFSLRLQEDVFKKFGNKIEWFKEGVFPFDFLSFLQSYRILKKLKPDVLHLHNIKTLSLSIISVAKLLKIPVVLTIYDYWYFCLISTLFDKNEKVCKLFHGSYCADCVEKLGLPRNISKFLLKSRKKIFDYFLNKVDKFIVLSKSSARILENYGIKKERISLIPLVFSPKKFKMRKVKPSNLILYAGWFVRHKGLHVLIKAMPKILKEVPDAKLITVGDMKADPRYTKFVLDLIKKNNLEDKISVFGKVPDNEFEKIYEKSFVIAILEQWENMSPVFLVDSMANKKAIVASRIGGMPEFIKNGKNGFLCEPNNPNDFAEKIIFLLKNKNVAKIFGGRAQKDISKMINEDGIFKKFDKLYKSLVKK